MSAITQSQPVTIEVKGVKTSHFLERENVLSGRDGAVQMGMTNVLKVGIQTTFYSLADRVRSRRRIARELGIKRETMGRHLQLRLNPAIPITGSHAAGEFNSAISITGSAAITGPNPAL